jgi:hypothetical protein
MVVGVYYGTREIQELYSMLKLIDHLLQSLKVHSSRKFDFYTHGEMMVMRLPSGNLCGSFQGYIKQTFHQIFHHDHQDWNLIPIPCANWLISTENARRMITNVVQWHRPNYASGRFST